MSSSFSGMKGMSFVCFLSKFEKKMKRGRGKKKIKQYDTIKIQQLFFFFFSHKKLFCHRIQEEKPFFRDSHSPIFNLNQISHYKVMKGLFVDHPTIN